MVLVALSLAAGRRCMMVAVRADGSPRISGTEVELADAAVHPGTCLRAGPVARGSPRQHMPPTGHVPSA